MSFITLRNTYLSDAAENERLRRTNSEKTFCTKWWQGL